MSETMHEKIPDMKCINYYIKFDVALPSSLWLLNIMYAKYKSNTQWNFK